MNWVLLVLVGISLALLLTVRESFNVSDWRIVEGECNTSTCAEKGERKIRMECLNPLGCLLPGSWVRTFRGNTRTESCTRICQGSTLVESSGICTLDGVCRRDGELGTRTRTLTCSRIDTSGPNDCHITPETSRKYGSNKDILQPGESLSIEEVCVPKNIPSCGVWDVNEPISDTLGLTETCISPGNLQEGYELVPLKCRGVLCDAGDCSQLPDNIAGRLTQGDMSLLDTPVKICDSKELRYCRRISEKVYKLVRRSDCSPVGINGSLDAFRSLPLEIPLQFGTSGNHTTISFDEDLTRVGIVLNLTTPGWLDIRGSSLLWVKSRGILGGDGLLYKDAPRLSIKLGKTSQGGVIELDIQSYSGEKLSIIRS